MQGEQKPADKVEPKFKVGDLIHNKWSNHSKEIVAVDDYQYTLNDGMPAPPFKVDIKEQDNWELVEQNIDSLPEEHGCEVNFTTKNEDLEEEIQRFVNSSSKMVIGVGETARHFAEWQKQKEYIEETETNESE